MTIEKAIEVTDKLRKCWAEPCLSFDYDCDDCELHSDPDELDDAREVAFRILKAWKSAKEEIKKTCGCTTAYDIMEKYEKEGET